MVTAKLFMPSVGKPLAMDIEAPPKIIFEHTSWISIYYDATKVKISS